MKDCISVIIATYNRCRDLKNTLESLLRQSEQPFDYEVIVVDNNSNDATKEIVQSYIEPFRGRLRYFFEPRQGKSFALSKGIKESRGTLLANTDDDCIVEEDWLKNIKAAFDRHDLDILTGKVIPRFDAEKPQWLDLNNKIFWGPYVRHDLGETYLENVEGPILPPGANMIFKKTSYERWGGFTTFTRAQDTEIAHAWQKQGAKIGYDPAVIVYHVTPASRLNKSYVRKWQFLCGQNSTFLFAEQYTVKRKFLGVPFWVGKNALKSILRYLKSIFLFRKDVFIRELWVWYNLGVIWSYGGRKTGFDNLR